jgi:hypothetical protein
LFYEFILRKKTSLSFLEQVAPEINKDDKCTFFSLANSMSLNHGPMFFNHGSAKPLELSKGVATSSNLNLFS